MFLKNELNYKVWGNQRYKIPSRVKFSPDDYQSKAGAVANAIARLNKLSVAAMQESGTSIYNAALGRPLKTGGYGIDGNFWFSIK